VIELKRYFVRFTHMVAGFNELRGIMRTYYNQRSAAKIWRESTSRIGPP